MFPIPKKRYQLLVLISLLVFYGFYLQLSKIEAEKEKLNQLNIIGIKEKPLDKVKFSLDSARNIGERLRLENQFFVDSSLAAQKNDGSLPGIITNYYKALDQNEDNYLKLYEDQAGMYENDAINNQKKIRIIESIIDGLRLSKLYFYVAAILFIYGFYLWGKNENKKSSTAIKKIAKYSLECQSCAKEFDSVTVYGTNKDGTDNYHFCAKCYQNGAFVNPELTKQEIKQSFWNALFTKYNITKEEYNKNKKFKKRLDTALKEFDIKISQVDRWKSIDY